MMIVWSSRKWQYIAVIICCVLVVLAVTAWRVIPLLIAKPTIKVDYLAEYNRITKPSDYDPNKNASLHYERLFSQFTPLPGMLKDKFKAWPNELSPSELATLGKWAPVSKSALEDLGRAAQCPYWWVEMGSSDGSLLHIELQYSDEHCECAWGIVLLAKYKASQKDTDGALQHLADLHTMGVHCAKGGTFLEQLIGLAICELCYDAILAILEQCDVKLSTLNNMREVFASRVPQLKVPRFTQGEFLVALDCMQRCFTDDGNNNGRLIPRELCRIKKYSGLYSAPLPYGEAVWICLNHPGRKETLELYQHFFEIAEMLAGKRPWELKSQSTSYEQELDRLFEGNYFLKDRIPELARAIEIGWRGRAHGEAVVTVLATLTYKAQKGHLPDSLTELAAQGYIDSAPIDPYSSNPLVYKVVGDNFILYSIGADFTDNGGIQSRWGEEGGDQVFWPVKNIAEDT